MEDPFNGGPCRSSNLYQAYQLQRPTSNDCSFRTHRLRQSLPTIDAMFQPSPSQQDHDMDCMSPSHGLQTASMNDLPFQPRPRRPQPIRRSNTDFPQLGRGQTTNSMFKPHPTRSNSAQLPPSRPTYEQDNPFWIPRQQQPPSSQSPSHQQQQQKATEPVPTRHKRFKDSFSTIPKPTIACEECERKDRVAREYWNRNKELEEEVSEKDAFIERLKEQRKDLENKVNELQGVVEGRR